ncbi:hypothetical protein AVEN_184260-1 [Araneus ventricosus]|uniref:Uncharacterized protein n=1 Tax=Araneus ventricosus TaxID=182803 RepID=A0A4Y2GP65_ARAVE|nr:hypothetical protein AVEN_184260-1 [Araneus ventricosus]
MNVLQQISLQLTHIPWCPVDRTPPHDPVPATITVAVAVFRTGARLVPSVPEGSQNLFKVHRSAKGKAKLQVLVEGGGSKQFCACGLILSKSATDQLDGHGRVSLQRNQRFVSSRPSTEYSDPVPANSIEDERPPADVILKPGEESRLKYRPGRLTTVQNDEVRPK